MSSNTKYTPANAVLAEYNDAINILEGSRADEATVSLLPSESDNNKDRMSRASITSFSAVYAENSKWLSAFLLLNNMIGSGILNQPYVFMKSGWVGGLLSFIFASYITWRCCNLMTDAGIYANIFDFSALANYAFGATGEKIIDISIAIQCFGAQLGYILVVGSTTSDLFKSWGCESAACGNDIVTVIICAVFVAPICMYRQFGHLAWLSVFSIATIWAVLLLVLIGGPLRKNDAGPYKTFSLVGSAVSMGSIVFALSISAANFQAYVSTERKSQNEQTWKLVTGLAVLGGALMCVAMGLSGYLSFRNETEGIILDNFDGSGFDVFKIMVCAHLIFYIPVNFMIMRYSVVKLASGKLAEKLPNMELVIISLILLAICVVCVILLRVAGLASGQAFAIVLNVTGGIGGSIVSFILPAAIYLKVMPRNENTKNTYDEARVIYYLGYLIMIVVVSMTIYDTI